MSIPYGVLNTGAKIPLFGLGTWSVSLGKAGLTECRLSKKGEVRHAVKVALQTGYTHIDCALIYGNENEVGEGIKDWGGDRSKIWVTSKLWNHQHHPSEVSKGLETTLKDLQLEYIDLYDPLILR
jgi:diketogulonate reductase-like aldo/keto reductase